MVIKLTGVEGMCHQTSQRWGDGSSSKPCWGYALSSKPVLRGCASSSKLVLRGCGIKQTGVESMCCHANCCWEDGSSSEPVLRRCVNKQAGVGMCYHAKPPWGGEPWRNRCWGDALLSKPVLKRCVITQTVAESSSNRVCGGNVFLRNRGWWVV